MVLEPIDRKSVVDQIAERVLSLIGNDGLQPGDKLPSENELMRALRVSRQSTREALKRIEAMGIVQSMPGQGYFVKEFHFLITNEMISFLLMDETLTHVQEARTILEVEVIARVTQRATNEEIDALERPLRRLSDLSAKSGVAPSVVLEHGWEFHRTLANLSGNPVLTKLVNELLRMIEAAQGRLYTPYVHPHYVLNEHLRIVEVVKTRDAQSARDEMLRHLSAVQQIMSSNLQKLQNHVSDGRLSGNAASIES